MALEQTPTEEQLLLLQVLVEEKSSERHQWQRCGQELRERNGASVNRKTSSGDNENENDSYYDCETRERKINTSISV